MNNNLWVAHDRDGVVALIGFQPIPVERSNGETFWSVGVHGQWNCLRGVQETPTPIFGLAPGEAAPVGLIRDGTNDDSVRGMHGYMGIFIDLARKISLKDSQ